MSLDEQDKQQKRKGRARRSVRAMARSQHLPVTAVVLAVAVGVALAAPRALSNAASTSAAVPEATGTAPPPNTHNVTWTPGDATQSTSSGGGTSCSVSAAGTVAAPSGPDAWIDQAVYTLSYEPVQVIDEPGQTAFDANVQQYSITQLGPPNISGTSITGQAIVNCKIVGTAWSSGAVGALAATYTYLAVSTIVTAAMWGYSATLPGGQANLPNGQASELISVTPAIAGCIGAAVATPILLSIGGGDQSALVTIAPAAEACLLDARDAQVDPTVLGAWLSAELSSVIPGASQIGGTGLADAASSTGTDLSPMTTAMTDAATGLAS
jgi:hypothetical protein